MNEKFKALTHLMEEATKGLPKDSKPVERIPAPKLPKGKLSSKDQWCSLLWSIDTAESHGSHALSGLTQALARIAQTGPRLTALKRCCGTYQRQSEKTVPQ